MRGVFFILIELLRDASEGINAPGHETCQRILKVFFVSHCEMSLICLCGSQGQCELIYKKHKGAPGPLVGQPGPRIFWGGLAGPDEKAPQIFSCVFFCLKPFYK